MAKCEASVRGICQVYCWKDGRPLSCEGRRKPTCEGKAYDSEGHLNYQLHSLHFEGETQMRMDVS